MSITSWIKSKRPHPKVHPNPDYKKSISFAFKIGPDQYYEFDSNLDMPPLRWQQFSQFYTEADMRIDRETLIALIDKAIEYCNSDNIKIVNISSILLDIKDRTNMIVETETLYRLATCVYFTIDEDLSVYDFDYNEKKLKLFKEQPAYAFFFGKLMKNLMPHMNISEKDLEVFLKVTQAQRRYEKDILHIDKSLSRR